MGDARRDERIGRRGLDLTWTFLEEASDDNVFRYKLQVVSDVYRAMQSRLDGYRQAASTIFIGVLAPVLAVDSAFYRTALDAFTRSAASVGADRDVAVLAIAALGILMAACAAGGVSLFWLHRIFAEMTSVVYRIDEANRLWEPGYLLVNEGVLPNNFKLGSEFAKHSVSRNAGADPGLRGWRDPAIGVFLWSTLSIMIVHLVVYGGMIRYFY